VEPGSELRQDASEIPLKPIDFSAGQGRGRSHISQKVHEGHHVPVPVVLERCRSTGPVHIQEPGRHFGPIPPWHPEHIAERYGLFTIIVGGLLILFSMWWVYFDRPADRLLPSARTAFIWGYGHLPVIASVAALGAGLAVAVDGAVGKSELGPGATGAAVAIPVAVFLLSMSLLYRTAHAPGFQRFALPVVVVGLVLAASVSPSPVLSVGLLVSGLVVVKVTMRLRSEERSVST
jgi:low temperature requirement protein LtrA